MGRKKIFNENEKRVNSAYSEIICMRDDFEFDEMREEDMMRYIATILQDAGVDTDIIIDIFERDGFRDYGKDIALGIKINEGY